MKKILCFALSAIMMLSMSMTAFAAEGKGVGHRVAGTDHMMQLLARVAAHRVPLSTP